MYSFRHYLRLSSKYGFLYTKFHPHPMNFNNHNQFWKQQPPRKTKSFKFISKYLILKKCFALKMLSFYFFYLASLLNIIGFVVGFGKEKSVNYFNQWHANNPHLQFHKCVPAFKAEQ